MRAHVATVILIKNTGSNELVFFVFAPLSNQLLDLNLVGLLLLDLIEGDG